MEFLSLAILTLSMGHIAPVDFLKAIAGGYGFDFVFPAFIPAPFLRPALVGIRRVFSVTALRVTPRRVPCKGCGSRYLTGCGIQFLRVLYFSRL